MHKRLHFRNVQGTTDCTLSGDYAGATMTSGDGSGHFSTCTVTKTRSVNVSLVSNGVVSAEVRKGKVWCARIRRLQDVEAIDVRCEDVFVLRVPPVEQGELDAHDSTEKGAFVVFRGDDVPFVVVCAQRDGVVGCLHGIDLLAGRDGGRGPLGDGEPGESEVGSGVVRHCCSIRPGVWLMRRSQR